MVKSGSAKENRFLLLWNYSKIGVNMNLSIVDATPAEVPQIKAIWRKNSKTLGFFPDGAFEDYVNKHQVLVAVDANKCVGYLLFRLTKGKVFIVHLSVDDLYQRQGVARQLVAELSKRTQSASGIELKCRTDFPVNTMWPHLGFVARAEHEGRSAEGKLLTSWWKGNGLVNLESLIVEETLANKIAVAVDANVFFDLEEEQVTTKNEESKSLLADWLQDSIEICLTPEIQNEVHRKKDASLRKQARTAISGYTVLNVDPSAFELAHRQVKSIFRQPSSESDYSDIRQIANAASAGVPFFVTRDSDVLEQAEAVYDALKLKILRPASLIAHLDELRREVEYRPAQFASTDLQCRRVNQNDLATCIKSLQRGRQGEGKDEFKNRFNRALAVPDDVYSEIVFDDSGPLGVFFGRSEKGVLNILLVRVREVASTPSIAPTMARALSARIIDFAVKNGHRLIVVGDPYLSPILQSAFGEDGFVASGRGPLRYILPPSGSSDDLVNYVRQTVGQESWASAAADDIINRLGSSAILSDAKQAAQTEDSLWPTRVLDAALPTYIVPIRPHWAQELFDVNLASQSMFGSMTKLVLNRESVYYRSATPGGIKAPARIVWYVSQAKDKHLQNTGAIRACSSLQEVHVGSAKSLFGRFRRLGVYQWRDLSSITKDNPHGNIMALKFALTYPFRSPIPWTEFQEVLGKHQCQGPIVSPHRIKNEAFMEIFANGMKGVSF